MLKKQVKIYRHICKVVNKSFKKIVRVVKSSRKKVVLIGRPLLKKSRKILRKVFRNKRLKNKFLLLRKSFLRFQKPVKVVKVRSKKRKVKRTLFWWFPKNLLKKRWAIFVFVVLWIINLILLGIILYRTELIHKTVNSISEHNSSIIQTKMAFVYYTPTPTIIIQPTPTEIPPTPSLEPIIETVEPISGNICDEVMAGGSTLKRESGYCWLGQYWIPGMVSYATQHLASPPVVIGTAVSYNPGVMQVVAENTGRDYSGYLGAVATEFCADVGSTVWIKRQGRDWEGPYLVIDCARPVGMYANIVYSEVVVEVDYETAVRWGAYVDSGVIVSKIGPTTNSPVNIRTWFLSVVTFGS